MDPRETLQRLLAVCGPGRLAVCGEGAGALVRLALEAGIDAWGREPEAQAASRAAAMTGGRVAHAAPGVPAWKDESFETVIVTGDLAALAEADAAGLIAEAARVSSRNVALAARPTEQVRFARADWERLAFARNLRRHPLYLLASPYRDLEHEAGFLAVLEKLPREAAERFTLAALARDRDLHMDMLREGGRRADAHAERYRLALGLARRGDSVLDVACGLGYGSRILFAGAGVAHVLGVDVDEGAIAYARANYGIPGRVDFRQGDATDLAFLPDASVDLVASFETLEHLDRPEEFLAHVERVLRPTGRLVVSVPHRWVDEHGRDPNPHHHHVYDWPRLASELGRHFILERGFAQTAGGGMVLGDRPRNLAEFPANATSHPEAEWLLAVAMKDPVAGKGIAFVDSMHPGHEGAGAPEVARFAKRYENPWLVRGMVTMGSRLARPDALTDMAHRAAEGAREGSVDRGAALCVEAYGLLDRADADSAEVRAMAARLRAWRRTAGKNPHHLRWRVSLAFVEGLLALRAGDLESAKASFAACATIDVSRFSPLLATKTVGAAWFAGLLEALAGERDAAAAHWRGGLEACREALCGDWRDIWGRVDAPLEFSLPEVADVATLASRCAYALNALPDLALRPGWFWQEVQRDLASQRQRDARILDWAARQIDDQRSGARWLSDELAVLKESLAHSRDANLHFASRQDELTRTLHDEESALQAVTRDLAATREGARYLESQRDGWAKTAGEHEAALRALTLELETTREGARYLESQRDAWAKAAGNSETAMQKIARELAATREGARYLESQRDAWVKAAGDHEATLQKVAGELEATRAGARYLESQRDAWARSAEELGRAITQETIRAQAAETEAGSLRAHVHSLETALAALEGRLALAREDHDAFARQRAVRLALAIGLVRPVPPRD